MILTYEHSSGPDMQNSDTSIYNVNITYEDPLG